MPLSLDRSPTIEVAILQDKANLRAILTGGQFHNPPPPILH